MTGPKTAVVTWGLLAALSLAAEREPGVAAGLRRCANANVGAPRGPADSKQCLSCHDGTFASDQTPLSAGLRVFGRDNDHPVMVSYEAAYLRDPGRFVPPSALNPRLRLLDGQMQCGTCHVQARDGTMQLAVTTQRSRLCLSCHRK
ncbi:MAG: hypothetical protein HZA90_10755 [Verrucomicrobia bacterium]|nr:hypothetical protein [Verrucomicrobiota bacterium]